jgi:putative protease
VCEDDNGTYIFSAKDLCLMPYLKELEEAGIASLKIEGRMKSFYYVACITRAYRRALDDLAAGNPYDPSLMEELRAVSHRDYTTGFLFGAPNADTQNFENGGYIRNTDVVAVAGDQPGWVIQKNKFSAGERLTVLAPDRLPYEIMVGEMRDGEGNLIEDAPHAEMKVNLGMEFPAHAIIRRER